MSLRIYFIKSLISWLLGLFFLSSAFASTDAGMRSETNEEFQQKVEQLNQRYEDFFVHEQEKKRKRMAVNEAADEQRKLRKKILEKREQERRSFVRKKIKIEGEMEHLKQMEMQKEENEKVRKYYIRKRDELNRIKESARKIPQEKEVGLE